MWAAISPAPLPASASSSPPPYTVTHGEKHRVHWQ